MAIELKDTATIARKFVQRAGAAGAEYTAGVTGKGGKWATNTAAGGDNYEQGVTAAIGRKAFQKGVSAAGPAKFEQKASTIGATRYPQGVAGAEAAFTQGFEKYANVLKGVALPPRAPKGSPQNLQRVAAVADALHRAKTGA
jgi:hypothetical protein